MRVEGHTDSRGKDEYNRALSDDRAKAVVAYLTSKGVAAERLVSQGFGEDQPIASNETKDGRAQNRRVEFVIVEREGCQRR
ncbi:MAG: OmpA family protein [Myxococcales bacterium]|nr:OmpA family protein [Myxococcales bacterium]